MTTKQITKPVAAGKKPVAASAATITRTAAAKPVVAKAAATPVAKVAPVVKAVVKAAPAATATHKEVVKSLFVMTDIARPQSGPRLFAHTVAAMSVLGMFGKNRPAVRKAALQAMIGSTAINYHTKRKGTLVDRGDTVALTDFGVGFFPSRNFDKAEAAGFEKLFKTGDGSAVKVRAQHIVPVSLAV